MVTSRGQGSAPNCHLTVLEDFFFLSREIVLQGMFLQILDMTTFKVTADVKLGISFK